MRINKYIALATGMSRRKADTKIKDGQVSVNGKVASLAQQVDVADAVSLNGEELKLPHEATTIILNKPAGYVCSRADQGSKTIYDLLPQELHRLKPVGRLDKDSSGLLLMTDDGELAHSLTHPKYGKEKVYKVTLNKPLSATDLQRVNTGVELEDGMSRLKTARIKDAEYEVRMSEGRNRQIRRTFSSLGYEVKKLHRVQFGGYKLSNLPSAQHTKP